MRTKITKLLGIDYPIIQASMAWISDASLVSAVSNAGGLGTLSPNAGSQIVTRDVDETGERLRAQIRSVRDQTNRPFAVNFVVGQAGQDRKFSERCVEVGIEESVPVAVVSQGSPAVFTERLKKAGIKVMQVISTVRHAIKAEEYGVDVIITSGAEGGGHSGFDLITSFCLVPQVVDAVKIPVIAGGGIGDARGLMAALSLGADAVYMGTRFIVTQECTAHDNVKNLILNTNDVGTISVGHGDRVLKKTSDTGNRGYAQERRGAIRLIMNDFLERFFHKREDWTIDNSFNYMEPFLTGELEKNTVTAGQVSGMVNEMPTCKGLIDSMVAESQQVLGKMTGMFNT